MPTIRIGLLLNGLALTAWEHRAVERCLALPGVELACVILPQEPEPPSGFLKRLWLRRRTLSYSLFDRLDRFFFRADRDPFAPADVSELFEGVPVIGVPVRRTRFRDYVEEGLDEVRALDPTLLVRFGFRILSGPILDLPPAGVWSFHHGDSRENRGGPPGFWEVHQGWPVTGATLQILTDSLDGGPIIERRWSATDPVSPTRHRGRYYWSALGMLPDAVQRLATTGVEEFLPRISEAQDPVPAYSKPLYRAPGNVEALRAGARLVRRAIFRRIGARLAPEQWALAYTLAPSPSFEFRRFQVRQPPPGAWWADPAVVYRNGIWWVFHEEMPAGRPGRISVQRVDDAGIWSEPEPVLEPGYHLSYPSFFRHDGELYMVPEASSQRRLEVWGCVEFPHRWEVTRQLFEGHVALDPTVFQHEGMWWMYLGWQEEEGSLKTDQLRLFMTDDPLNGSWEPHPANPLVNDARGARPAGQPFTIRDRLIRPGQDCSGHYGRGLIFKEVLELSPERYRESESASVLPEWNPRVRGIHTFNFAEGLTVIDALFRGRRT